MQFQALISLALAAAATVTAAPVTVKRTSHEPQCETICSDGFTFTESCSINYVQDSCTSKNHGTVESYAELVDPDTVDPSILLAQCENECSDGYSWIDSCEVEYYQDPCETRGHGYWLDQNLVDGAGNVYDEDDLTSLISAAIADEFDQAIKGMSDDDIKKMLKELGLSDSDIKALENLSDEDIKQIEQYLSLLDDEDWAEIIGAAIDDELEKELKKMSKDDIKKMLKELGFSDQDIKDLANLSDEEIKQIEQYISLLDDEDWAEIIGAAIDDELEKELAKMSKDDIKKMLKELGFSDQDIKDLANLSDEEIKQIEQYISLLDDEDWAEIIGAAIDDELEKELAKMSKDDIKKMFNELGFSDQDIKDLANLSDEEIKMIEDFLSALDEDDWADLISAAIDDEFDEQIKKMSEEDLKKMFKELGFTDEDIKELAKMSDEDIKKIESYLSTLTEEDWADLLALSIADEFDEQIKKMSDAEIKQLLKELGLNDADIKALENLSEQDIKKIEEYFRGLYTIAPYKN